MARALRLLAIGGDPSLWVALSEALGDSATQMFFPKDIDAPDLLTASNDADIIVVVTSPGDADPTVNLRLCKDLGLQRKTIAIGEPHDEQTAAEVVALGMAGYVVKGVSTKRLMHAIWHVFERGVTLDGPAADAFSGRALLLDELEPDSQMSAARALASALELKDTYTGGHAERVTGLAMRLAHVALMENALPSDVLQAAFLLHDVGKIGIPESILTKPGGLTHIERRVIQTHPILGERIIAPLGLPPVIHDVVRHHHEWWDGSGYPDGLSQEKIPSAARLFAIADAIDAMTSVRPYRRPQSFEMAIDEILRCAGTQFDPNLARLAEKTFLEGPIKLVDAS